jgi:hypothetical protein
MNIKAFWKSKTLWTGILIPTIIAVIPGAADWVKDNPQLASYLFGALLIVLRAVTKGAISFNPSDFSGVGLDASALKNTAKIIIVFFLLGFSLSARAQTYSIAKGMDAHSWLYSTITSAATTPDTVLLVGGGGVAFDSLTTPFPIEVTVNQKQYIAGQTLPVTSPWREIFSVTYVSGDTLVLGSRALYGTLARQWGPGSAVAYSMAGYEASMSSLSFDSITSSKTLTLPTTPYHVTVMNATGTFRDTLPTPTVSNNGQRWIFSLTNATDTVTLYQTSVGFNGKGSSGSVTFTQASGNSIELLLWDRNYYWVSENNATTH